jgi:hypothetical protein
MGANVGGRQHLLDSTHRWLGSRRGTLRLRRSMSYARELCAFALDLCFPLLGLLKQRAILFVELSAVTLNCSKFRL